MRHVLKYSMVILLCLLAQNALAELVQGEIPKVVTLQEKLGGRLDGTPFSTEEFKDKVTVLFYVDPDEKDLNNEASEALKAEKFSLDKYQSYAIINMGATWLPNFAISSSLKEKQKIYTTTTYVRDYKKTLVKEWGLSDDNSDVLAFDQSGKLIFRKDGKLGQQEIQALISVIKANIDR